MGKTSRVIERRYTAGEVEVRQSNGSTYIEGHAAVFNRLSQNLGGFVEQVAPGTFAKTITEADVRALKNHDPNLVLGRNRAGTLELAEDNTGLYYRITSPDTSYARDLLVSLERGDINQSSFAFIAIDDEWGLTAQDFPLRTLTQVQLIDVSPVTYPAYVDTDSSIGRAAALAGLALRSGVQVNDLSDVDAIKRAIANEETPQDEPEPHSTRQEWGREQLRRLAILTSAMDSGLLD